MYVDQEKELATMTHAKEIEKVRIMTFTLKLLHSILFNMPFYDLFEPIPIHVYIDAVVPRALAGTARSGCIHPHTADTALTEHHR